MISADILSKILKEKRKFGTNEGINFENTFIQQTKGSQNLWKIQLGEMNSYLLFFKLEVTLEETPTDRFLLQMFPKDCLCIRKCSGRKLEVTFPKGIRSYFKLPVGRGCGTAWAKWRGLQDTCGRLSVSQKPQFVFFNTHELGADILRTLKEKGFMNPLFLTKSSQGVLEAGWLLWMKSNAPEESDRAFEPVELVASSSLENKINKWLESAKKDVPRKANNISPKKEGKKAVVKLSRVVQRFGEGVPDGCTLHLSLTTDYPADDPDSSKAPGKKPMCHHVRSTSGKRNQKQLNIFEYLCKERLASEATADKLEHNCKLQTSDPELVRGPKKNLVDPAKTSLNSSQSGSVLVYGKKADLKTPLVTASHSGPIQSYEKLLAEFEKPSIKASDLLPPRSPKKNLVDSSKRSFKASQSGTARSPKKKPVDLTKRLLEASHSSSIRNTKKNLTDSGKSPLRASRSGTIRRLKKTLIDSSEPLLKASHSGPVKSPKKKLVDSTKPLLEATNSTRNTMKNLADFEKSLLRASQSDTIRRLKKNLLDPTEPLLEASHSGPVRSPKKNLADSGEPQLKASKPSSIRGSKKNLADSGEPQLKASKPSSIRGSKKNLADSGEPQLKASKPSSFRGSKKNLAYSGEPQLKASQPSSIRSPKKNLADSPKPSRVDYADPVHSFVKNLLVTAKRSLEDGDLSWETNISDSRPVQKDTPSYIDFTKPLELPPPDISSSRFGSILRPFHYLLEPRKWTGKVPLLVPSSRSFRCNDSVSQKRR